MYDRCRWRKDRMYAGHGACLPMLGSFTGSGGFLVNPLCTIKPPLPLSAITQHRCKDSSFFCSARKTSPVSSEAWVRIPLLPPKYHDCGFQIFIYSIFTHIISFTIKINVDGHHIHQIYHQKESTSRGRGGKNN